MTSGGCEGYAEELDYVYREWRKTEVQLEEALNQIASLQGHLIRVERSNEKMGYEAEKARQEKISGG